jgi:flagellar assembly factor FliW
MISASESATVVLDPTARVISSVLLGEIEVSAEVIMHFPTPLWGFPDLQDFALLPAAREGLWWMQSCDNDALTFLLADPFVLDKSYAVDLGETERAALQIEQPADAFSLVMIALPTEVGADATANFRAPLVFNLGQHVGMQIVSRDETHQLRKPVVLDAFPPQAHGLRLQ